MSNSYLYDFFFWPSTKKYCILGVGVHQCALRSGCDLHLSLISELGLNVAIVLGGSKSLKPKRARRFSRVENRSKIRSFY